MKKGIKPILFCMGIVLMIGLLQKVFCVSDPRIYQFVQGFYAQPDGSLDAVYVGASNVYAYWQAPLAWKDFGCTVYPMTVPGMPARSVRYVIEEARKTQPDALYIVNLNEFKEPKVTEKNIHYLVDYLPMSRNKLAIINDLTKELGAAGFDKLEYLFPIIRFHSGWSTLKASSFDFELNGLMGAVSYPDFLQTATKAAKSILVTEGRAALTADQEEVMEELLSYCAANEVKVLFVFVPQVIKNEETLGQINTMTDLAKARGFDVLNLQTETNRIGLDVKTDFYNLLHTNVHGSIKYTYYLGQYLMQHYNFEDKRGNADFTDWDQAADSYLDIISKYTTDFELEHLPRDYGLWVSSPNVSVQGEGFSVNWEEAEGAQEYLIYRKGTEKKDKHWKLLATVTQDVRSYEDGQIRKNEEYQYIVVPARYENRVVLYGSYDIHGSEGVALERAVMNFEEEDD